MTSPSWVNARADSPKRRAVRPVPRSYAAMAAVGPWILAVLALLVISKLTTPVLGQNRVEEIRGIVIYAFMLSLTTSAPIALIATRILSDDLFRYALERCSSLVLGALILAASITAILSAIVFGIMLRTPFEIGIIGASLSILIALVWISAAFCAAIEDFAHIFASFAAGLACAVLGSVTLAYWTANSTFAELGLLPGISIIFFWLSLRLLATFPEEATSISSSIKLIARGLLYYRALALGALIGGAAIWIDKWILWLSPYGMVIAGGLVQAPLYDSPMFVAYIGVLPSLALLATTLQTTFFDHYKLYYESIEGHGTLAQIRSRQSAVLDTAVTMILRIMGLQAAISVIMILLSPRLIEIASLDFAQLSVLRFGILGALFQFVFVASNAVLLFFNQHGRFAWLQMLYVLLLVVATLATIQLGTEYLGLGYLVASVAAGIAAFIVLEKTLRELNYLTFIVANANRPPPP